MEQIKILAKNKKAQHNYFILRKIECGIELFGTEVKSIRLGKVNISDAYASVENGEIFVKAMNVSPYEQGNIFNRDPLRDKKLLLHKNEIRKLDAQVTRQGYTLIPLELYMKDGKVKIQLGVCKGKHLHDKRDAMAKRDSDLEMRRALRIQQKE